MSWEEETKTWLEEQVALRQATMDDTLQHTSKVLSHITNVRNSCNKLGFKLIKLGEVELGRKLIANGQIHDNSKLHGFEFENLRAESPLLDKAVAHHQKTNPHHPEYWWDGVEVGRGIYQMPEEYFAEMVCDCVARAQEFGTDARIWFFTEAQKKYEFGDFDTVGKRIKRYLDLLLEPAFKKEHERK